MHISDDTKVGLTIVGSLLIPIIIIIITFVYLDKTKEERKVPVKVEVKENAFDRWRKERFNQ